VTRCVALPVMLDMDLNGHFRQPSSRRRQQDPGTWSLIKMVPDHQLSPLRARLLDTLCEESHLTEDELVVIGLKYLHRTDKARSGDRAALRRGIE